MRESRPSRSAPKSPRKGSAPVANVSISNGPCRVLRKPGYLLKRTRKTSGQICRRAEAEATCPVPFIHGPVGREERMCGTERRRRAHVQWLILRVLVRRNGSESLSLHNMSQLIHHSRRSEGRKSRRGARDGRRRGVFPREREALFQISCTRR